MKCWSVMLLPWVSGTLGKPPEKIPLSHGLGEGSRVQIPAGPPYHGVKLNYNAEDLADLGNLSKFVTTLNGHEAIVKLPSEHT